jgi:F-type H+-transporting ATPase subunit delta
VTLAKGRADLVLSELGQFQQLLGSSEELRTIFTFPTFSKEKRQRVLEALLERLQSSPEVGNFLRLLLRQGRLTSLAEIVRAFEAELDRRRGIAAAEITTARPLTEQQRQMLLEALQRATGLTIRPYWKQDRSLIGGACIRIGDHIFDGSVRARLAAIKQQMMGETLSGSQARSLPLVASS